MLLQKFTVEIQELFYNILIINGNMLIGAKSRYAVMAMVDLANRSAGKPVSLAELAEAQEIPLPYLEQLFAQLRRADLVHSVRGPGGGYILAKSAGQTCIADIVQAVDESLTMTRCNKDEGRGCLSSKAKCMTHDLWDGLGNHIVEYLNGITLADVCNKRPKHQLIAS